MPKYRQKLYPRILQDIFDNIWLGGSIVRLLFRDANGLKYCGVVQKILILQLQAKMPYLRWSGVAHARQLYCLKASNQMKKEANICL